MRPLRITVRRDRRNDRLARAQIGARQRTWFQVPVCLVVNGKCVLRYDNESGKGDHKHLRGRETAVAFSSIDELVAQFIAEVERMEEL